MLEKRDLQLVRLAVRRKWLTAEEGEDCLFLKRKLGERYTIEEVIRKRGYLDDAALAELSTDTERLTRRRPAPATKATPPKPSAPPARPAAADQRREALEPAPLPRSQPAAAARTIEDREATVLGKEALNPPLGRAQVATDFEDGGFGTDEMPPPMRDVAAEDATMLGVAALAPSDELPSLPPEEMTVIGIRVEDLMRERHRQATQRSVPPTVTDPAPPPKRISLPAITRDPIPAPSRSRSMRGWSSTDDVPTGPEGYAPRDPAPVIAEPLEPRSPPDRQASRWIRPAAVNDDDRLLGEHGAWNLRRVIGRGSTAVVYLAEAADGGDPVALKLLKTELLSSREAVERFQREATVASVIDSPRVVPLRGTGYIGDRPFIALQYVDGFTLRERLDADEPPDLADALRIAREVALALVALERAGVVHRDVKPENVIVGSSGEVYLTDFGLAREIGATPQGGLTAISDTVVGTPNYMAPEQAIGGTVDHRTDQYALGATLFHVLTGRPPFAGRSSVSIISKHVRSPVPDVVAIDPRIPPPVAAIVQRLMAKIPGDRYASALDLVEAIEQVLATLAPADPKIEAVVTPAAISSFAVTAALTTLALGAAIALRNGGFAAWGNGENIGVETAFGGASLVIAAILMLGAIGLVRRGELPLPGSTSWLVTVKDATGVVGAGFVLASAALGPPATLDIVVLALGTLVLGSWVFGFFLRTAIARQRRDRGGHVLALFGDVRLRRWRRVHVPLLLSLAGLATMRFAILAYFQAAS